MPSMSDGTAVQGGPRGRVVMGAEISLPRLTIRSCRSGMGSSPTRTSCKASQVLLADVPGGYSRGSPVGFARLV